MSEHTLFGSQLYGLLEQGMPKNTQIVNLEWSREIVETITAKECPAMINSSYYLSVSSLKLKWYNYLTRC